MNDEQDFNNWIHSREQNPDTLTPLEMACWLIQYLDERGINNGRN